MQTRCCGEHESRADLGSTDLIQGGRAFCLVAFITGRSFARLRSLPSRSRSTMWRRSRRLRSKTGRGQACLTGGQPRSRTSHPRLSTNPIAGRDPCDEALAFTLCADPADVSLCKPIPKPHDCRAGRQSWPSLSFSLGPPMALRRPTRQPSTRLSLLSTATVARVIPPSHN